MFARARARDYILRPYAYKAALPHRRHLAIGLKCNVVPPVPGRVHDVKHLALGGHVPVMRIPAPLAPR
jgi:hypothetical protein